MSAGDELADRLYRQSKSGIELGLESMSAALEREGRPDRDHPVVLIGGTNGKGETAAYLASILQAHDLKIGLFTSPHLIDVGERFRVDGRLVEPETMRRLARRILDDYGQIDGQDGQLSFFEMTTLMAALAFADAQVDVGIYEVGLGGRLDATNALAVDMAVVTSVGLDHQAYLGESIAEIAGEKAGIFRPGRPAVVGRQRHRQAHRVLERCAPKSATFYGSDFDADAHEVTLSQPAGSICWQSVRWHASLPPTRRWNVACAAEAAGRYLGDAFDRTRAAAGLGASRWPGRFDRRVMSARPGWTPKHPFIFDAAHNPPAAELLFAYLAAESTKFSAVVCSAMADKDLGGLFGPIPASLPVFAAQLNTPRGADCATLSAALADKNLCGCGPTDAMLAAARRRVDDAPILVFGSIYLLGECFRVGGIAAHELVTHRPQG